MEFLTSLLFRKRSTASIAKERLKVIVAERRSHGDAPHYLPQLKRDIIEIICKYVEVDPDMVTIQLEQQDKDISILELNVAIPETEKKIVID
jgi:cell division topological specificity factor